MVSLFFLPMKTLIYLFTAVILVGFTSSQETEKKLDTLIDNWHKAASEANFKAYFDVMDTQFVFLGTAPGERWRKAEFASFSKPYFDKGKAWDFKAKNRKWQFNTKKDMAWFDEDLDTWMLGCRGSGILVKQKKEWKLMYYNLTVLIENEKMPQFIELRQAK